MTTNNKQIITSLEKSLAIMKNQKGDDFVAKIKPILESNLDRGRIFSFIEGNFDLIHNYVSRVADHYENLSAYIFELQVTRSNQVWEPLYRKMQRWVFNYFLKKNFSNDTNTQNIAEECATEAALNILSAYFPYDTDFEPWAYVVVQFACLKYIRKETRASVVPYKKLIALDDALNHIVDPVSQKQQQQNELHDVLLTAISQLSESRRQVIELLYLDGMSPGEVASQIGKSISAIYSMRFNALIDLQNIFKNGNIYYE